MKINFKLMAAAIVFLAACKKENVSTQSSLAASGTEVSEAMVQENGDNPDETMLTVGNKLNTTGHVYIESNDAGGNAVVVYTQQLNGKLSWSSSTNSGGNGSGAGLGSQSAIAVNKDDGLLFAVNAGSNSVSSFKINNDGSLELKATVGSGGTLPVSVCTKNNLVYVVNSTTANISGYTVDADGNLASINGSETSLSDITALPAQIAFSPDGNTLLVTEKTTSKISSFSLDANGVVTSAVYTNSVGEEPFGFDFSRGKYMIVSNAFQGADNASTCTSYTNLSWNISDVNGSVANHQSASCWVKTTKYGRYAFVTNAKSNNIVTYYVNPSGAIYYLPWSPAVSGAGPNDITVSDNNLFVYNINSGDHSITEFIRGDAGTLRSIGTVTSIPSAAAGIVAD
jgi:6-phosphogluconolactonase